MLLPVIIMLVLAASTLATETGGRNVQMCDKAGNCTCNFGYYGPNCELKCSDNCFLACDKTTGRCADCAYNKYGDLCDKPCPANCLSTEPWGIRCDRETGDCLGCIQSRYGDKCDKSCSERCGGDGSCMQKSGRCMKCDKYHYGRSCKKCCDHCRSNKCSRNGKCVGCRNGFYGANCTLDCTRCKGMKCNVETGACLRGCKKGMMGKTCSVACSSGCKYKKCDHRTGRCTRGCVKGKTGKTCQKTEPEARRKTSEAMPTSKPIVIYSKCEDRRSTAVKCYYCGAHYDKPELYDKCCNEAAFQYHCMTEIWNKL